METTAVGWQGPAPGSTDQVGWLGVSRETEPLPVAPTPRGEAVTSAVASGAEPTAPVGAAGEDPAAAPVDSAFAEGVPTAADVAARPIAEHASDPPLAHSVAEAQRQAGPVARPALPPPDATRVFVVANQKGGVGKTTTAVNIAAVLSQHGQRVLLIDLDPQGNASTAVGVDHTEGTPSAYQVLIAGMQIAEVVADCPHIDGLVVVPATIDLAGAEIELVSLVARETRLRKALDTYLAAEDAAGRRFDYVFIDCPPSLGLLTVNALSAGRQMLIPIQCE